MDRMPVHIQPSAFSFRRAIAAILAVFLFAVPQNALAQAPTAVDPAQLEKRFEPQPAPLPTAPAQDLAPPKPRALTKEQQALAKKRFVLKSVAVEGATVFTQNDLRHTYANQLGKEISLLDAQAIADRITDHYRQHDYILSQALLPAQSINGGTLKIRVIEGFIGDVVIQGDVRDGGAGRHLVQEYAEQLKSKRPVKAGDLERYLLLIDDLPGATAKGLVRPSRTKVGAADLVITVTHKAVNGSYTLDNRGTKFVGPWQHSGVLVANSAFNMYDRTLFRFATVSPTKELRFYNLQHEHQLGREGTRLVLDLSHSHAKPGDSLKPLQLVGDSYAGALKVLHPFLRSRNENLVGRLQFDARNTDTDTFVNTNLTYDRLRVLRGGGSYDFADRFRGVNLIDVQVSQGLGIFNATDKGDASTDPTTDGVFTKATLDITRTQALPRGFSLYVAGAGQYASQKLLAAEKFSIGGTGFGRAYDPAELAGDHGVAGSAELRYGQMLNDPYLQSYQVYGFYDIGRVWIDDAAAGGNDKMSLASAGFGLRTNFSEHLSSSLEVGVPLTKEVNNQGNHEKDPRLFFSMTGRF